MGFESFTFLDFKQIYILSKFIRVQTMFRTTKKDVCEKIKNLTFQAEI